MNFANPAALWGLFALLVPVAVHLFSFRTSKRVLFSNLALLTEIKQESSKRRLLKERLLLISRLLAIVAVVLAFAQPQWDKQTNLILPGSRFHAVFIDNSPSMLIEGPEGLLLEQAREAARAIALAASPNERFQLLTHDFSPLAQRWLTRDAFLAALEEVRPAFVSRLPAEILARQLDAMHDMADSKAVQFYWISDFQKSAMPLDGLTASAGLRMQFIQLQPQEVANIYVDTAWLEPPLLRVGEKSRLLFRLKNGGRSDASGVLVQLRLADVQKGLANVDIAAGSSVVDTIDFTPDQAGVFGASLDIDDRSFPFDDRWFMQFKVESKMPLLYLRGARTSPYLKALFEKDEFVSWQEASSLQIDLNQLKATRALIAEGLDAKATGLLEALKSQVEAGASLIYLPGETETRENLQGVLSFFTAGQVGALLEAPMMVRKLDLNDKLFQETFSSLPEQMLLPTAKKYFSYKPHPADRILMELANGDAWMVRRELGAGNVLVLMSPLQPAFTDLPQQALFVPTFYRAVQLGGGLLPTSFRLRDALSIELKSSDLPQEGVLSLINEQNNWLPEVRRIGNRVILNLSGHKLAPGHYQITVKNQVVSNLLLAMNGDETESQLDYFKADELAEWADRKGWQQQSLSKASLAGKLLEDANSSSSWKWLLLGVLVFLLAEVLILKFLR